MCVCFPLFNLFSVCALAFLTGIMYGLHILHVCDADSREIRHGRRRLQHVMHGGTARRGTPRKGKLGRLEAGGGGQIYLSSFQRLFIVSE